jgi:hypothetical protein
MMLERFGACRNHRHYPKDIMKVPKRWHKDKQYVRYRKKLSVKHSEERISTSRNGDTAKIETDPPVQVFISVLPDRLITI